MLIIHYELKQSEILIMKLNRLIIRNRSANECDIFSLISNVNEYRVELMKQCVHQPCVTLNNRELHKYCVVNWTINFFSRYKLSFLNCLSEFSLLTTSVFHLTRFQFSERMGR